MSTITNRRLRHRGQGGFTLIELLVVIAVLAILAGIVIFNVTGVTNRGSGSACATDVKSVQSAVDAYVGDNPGTPDPFAADVAGGGVLTSSAASNIWTILVPNYIHSVPNIGECKIAAMSIHYVNGSTSTNGYVIQGT